MEKYKDDTGRYPENVTDLIPRYIEKISIINFSSEGFDQTKYDVLQSEKLQASGPFINDNGNYFSIRLLPKDDRICLLGGKNNICEYTSQNEKMGLFYALIFDKKRSGARLAALARQHRLF